EIQGPEIRTGFLKDGKPIELKQGSEILISTDYNLRGDETQIAMSYKKIAEDVKPGSRILCSDGTISLRVLSCDREKGLVNCLCENSATLGEKKNVNLPGVIVDLPTLTEKDKDDILNWGIPNKIDVIALSFVRKGSDLAAVRSLIGEKNAKNIMLMSKVENQEGIVNIDEIIASSDALMVARGDLGMEIPVEKIFLAQKTMIRKANIQGKPVVTATQMLESMIKSPRPTRAEATDVANAVLDGTDCVMLSGETAAGAYPEAAVRTMARICVEAERSIVYGDAFKRVMKAAPLPLSPLESLAASAVRTAKNVNASLIVVLTRGGSTARLLAKYRPHVPILSVVVPEAPARHGLISWGVVPVLSSSPVAESDQESAEVSVERGLEVAKERGICRAGDSVVALHRVGMATVIKIVQVQ
ncbi:unnamed protein product, partial [Linum tenue]